VPPFPSPIYSLDTHIFPYHKPSLTCSQSTGNVGAPIVSALSFSNFNVTAVSRSLPTTASPFPSTVSHKTTDYTSTSLTTLFQNQDALILAFNPSALSLHHRTITNTAIASGIKHVITPDFCTDTFTENVEELKIFEPKLDAQRYLEDKIKGTETKWTAIVTGPFWDWGRFIRFCLLNSSILPSKIQD
jgi:hypothetical protein